MKSPISIYGGKHYMLKFLLPKIPVHKTYVEAFGGGAKLLLAKPISPIEVYNDLDSNLVNFFRVLRNKEQTQELIRLCGSTPYSREEFYELRKDIDETEDPVERAWKFFAVSKMAFSGRLKSPSWAKCITQSRRSMCLQNSSWISAIESLEELHERIFSVLIEHSDFRKLIPSCDTEETFFFLDPPYVQSVRKGKDRYKHEMTDDDHQELLEIVLKSKGKFLISGYDNAIYELLERNGWNKEYFQTTSWAAARTNETGLNKIGSVSETQTRKECIWMSPNCK